MREKIIAGNWKMNSCLETGLKLADSICQYLNKYQSHNAKVILAVPFTHIYRIANSIDLNNISIAAQNCASEESGAFTGEVSANMIKSAGANYVIIGHSERRQYFCENDKIFVKKINICLKNSLKPIFCCGESLIERNENNHFEIVKKQINTSLFNFNENEIENLIIAYEPVWAIGTGINASPEQAQEMHKFIRKLISEKYNITIANNIKIIYGGSVKPDNAKDLFAQQDIDGGLIGGASLKAEDFLQIIKAI